MQTCTVVCEVNISKQNLPHKKKKYLENKVFVKLWVKSFTFCFGLQVASFIRQQVDFHKWTTGISRRLQLSDFDQGDQEPFWLLLIFYREPEAANVAIRKIRFTFVFRKFVQIWVNGPYNISSSFKKRQNKHPQISLKKEPLEVFL